MTEETLMRERRWQWMIEDEQKIKDPRLQILAATQKTLGRNRRFLKEKILFKTSRRYKDITHDSIRPKTLSYQTLLGNGSTPGKASNIGIRRVSKGGNILVMFWMIWHWCVTVCVSKWLHGTTNSYHAQLSWNLIRSHLYIYWKQLNIK